MKKFFFFAAALASSMFAQAQQIVSFGFEDADKGNYHCQYALTPRPDGLGDWVNVHEGDTWTEQSEDAARTGKYGLQVLNSEEGSSNSWDRGFKLANLPIKENVPYRVSFWIKGPEGVEGKLSSWLSVGMENFDKSFTTAGGSNYGLDQITLNGDGEWQRVSFLSVYHGKEAIKTVIDGQSWVGNAVFPEQFGGDGVQTYKEHFGGYIPETFFFIANMNTAGEYMLDDICIEENVTIAGATFNEECVKIDFGFPTNIADLAKANNGILNLPTSCVVVKQGDQVYEIEFLEGHSDGYLYAFLPDGVNFDTESTDPVTISFTPDAECPIKYTSEKRPGADIENVLGFESEVAYVDFNIDAFSQAWSAPEFVSVFPENNSFNLSAADVRQIVLNFNKEISLDIASASWVYSDNFGSYDTDLTDNMTIGENGTSLIITLPANIEDNQYKLIVNGVANVMGMEMENDVELVYEFGNDTEATEVETMYKSDFNGDETDAVPQGWNTYNEAGYHLYGFNADGSRMKYGYGANPGGGGTRLFDGFSGDFTKALYWGTRGTNEGYASFGELIKDYMDGDGNIDEASLPDGVSKEDISLYLEPGKYNVSFKMAAWKGAPQFNFTLEDLDGEVFAKFEGYTAKPNLNGAKGKVTGTLALEADFSIEKEGYYVLKFVSAEAQWQEFMLADVQVITMPSKAAYYNGLVAAAIEKAEDTLYEAYDLEGSEAFNNLDEEIESAKKVVLHSPSEASAQIAKLEELEAVLLARLANIQTYDGNIDAVKEGIIALEGTKYLNVDVVAEAADVVAKYGDKAGKDLTDEELAAAAPIVAASAAALANVQACTDRLTWGIYKALQTAELLGAEDAAAIEAGQNAISDDREVAKAINDANKIALYKKIVAGEWASDAYASLIPVNEMKIVPIENEEGTYEDWQKVIGDSLKGIEMTGYVANPKMYRVNGNGNNELPGWTIAANGEHDITIGWGGTAPSAAEYVTDQYMSQYGDGDYDMSQTISDLPVGRYAVVMATRTPLVDKFADYGRMFYYNDQDSVGNWDKYMYAAVEGQDKVVTPYLGLASYYGSHNGEYNTVVKVAVGENDQLTIGLNEHYVSGKAMKHEDNTAQSSWTGTTMADDVHIYFIAPLEGYDYAAALKGLETSLSEVQPNATIVDIYNVNGVRLAKAQKGINIVKMSNGKVVKVMMK